MPNTGTTKYSVLLDITVCETGMRKLIEAVKLYKTTGPDAIPATLLKDYAAEIAPVLTLIYQVSLDQGTVPVDWKHAWVILVYKKGDRGSPSNYRPISLTSISCKTMHIIHSNFMDHLENLSILIDYQHGFRKRRSCESELIQTVDDLAKGLHDAGPIDAVLMDFSKAFDKWSHSHLAAKPYQFGVRGNTLDWIQSFLSKRTQEVVLDGKRSFTAAVTPGVPQGTVLGPILFLCYINDLLDQVSSTARLIADDWLMEFNPDKCDIIRITNRRKKKVVSCYSIHVKVLKEVTGAKYLGVTIDRKLTWIDHIAVTIDRKLTWIDHIANITKKANNTRAFLQRNIISCHHAIKSRCYQTFVSTPN